MRIESTGCRVRCEEIGLSKLLSACMQPGMDLTEQQVRSAFERGDLCIGAYTHGRLVGYQWIALGATPHVAGLWAQVPIGPEDCYFYKLFVHPDFRGLHIADALSAEADRAVIGLGRDRVLGFIDVHNLSSWNTIKRRGGWTAGYVGYFDCLGISLPFRTPGAASYGCRFFNPPNLKPSKEGAVVNDRLQLAPQPGTERGDVL